MKPNQKLASLIVSVCLLSASALGNETANPYAAIIERNPFGLKPPPPPPDPNAAQEVKQPPCKVTLTGITSLFGPNSQRALLEIEEQDQGKKNVRKPILSVGQREGSVELLSIDIASNKVRIRNDDVETELTFEKPKPTAGPAPGVVPPHIPSPLGRPAAGPHSVVAGAPAAGSSAAPLIISRNSGGAREPGSSGVSVFGGDQFASSGSPAAAAAPVSIPVSLLATSADSGRGTGANLASISRPLRTGVSMPTMPQNAAGDSGIPAGPRITREQAATLYEVHRLVNPIAAPDPPGR